MYEVIKFLGNGFLLKNGTYKDIVLWYHVL